MKKKRIVVAMSGGVDSSVVAAMLAKQEYEVIGVTLRLWTPSPWNNGEQYGGCCSPRDIADAKKVCAQIGVPHYTFNTEKKFKEKVVDNFISEYLEGKTPNPCVQCNNFIKFDLLFKYALALNADYLATGHYARILEADARCKMQDAEYQIRDKKKKTMQDSHSESHISYHLCKAVDSSKDQSYFLYMLNQMQLSKILFPLGNYTKSEVREMAKELNLIAANKEDSQDVCFLEGRNYQKFIQEQVSGEKIEKGSIQTKEGKILGEHQGLAYYTIGQREKLGVAAGHPLYVIEKDLQTNTLIVGKENENLSLECKVNSVNWCSDIAPVQPIKANIKIRYRHPGYPAMISPKNPTEVEICFDAAQPSITPGQSAVFYNDHIVLGGGTIAF